MVSATEYMTLDAVEMASLVRVGELSASELLEAAIARAELVNPRLNAVIIPMFDLARARATTALSGPLAGVPFLVKDLYQDYAGVLATSGSRAFRRAGIVPQRHSEIVARWLAAGAVIFGRTNTPEFGAKGITEPDAWGPTRNPWRLTHSPGGSSGGAAAAVAAGIVPAAGASDGGGSIRIPASSTGLFGLKPGRGRTPNGPIVGEVMHGAAVHHVIARTVRDSAALLDATHGRERGSSFVIAPPERPYLEEVGREPGRLRVAYSTRSPLGTPVHPEAVAAVEHAAHLLESLGHDVEQAEPAIDGVALARDFTAVWFAQMGAQVQAARTALGASSNDFELDTLAMEAVGKSRSAVSYVESYVRWQHYGRSLSEFLARCDVYVTPTMAEPPPRIGEVKTLAWAERLLRAGMPFGVGRLLPYAARIIEQITLDHLRRVPFTQLANVTGVPAMSVPLASYADGLPLGVQFVTDHGGEGRLFSLAAQLEQAAPWRDRRPTLD